MLDHGTAARDNVCAMNLEANWVVLCSLDVMEELTFRCRDAPTDRLHSLQAELTVQNRSPLLIYLFPLVSSRHLETQRTEQDMTSQEKKHGAKARPVRGSQER